MPYYYRRFPSRYTYRGARFANVDRTMPLVTGNTFPVKEALKALDSRVQWDGEFKGWRVPLEHLETARSIVSRVPAKRKSVPAGSRYSNTYQETEQYQSGRQYYVNPNGRCEDAPCCGCCGYM